MRNLPIFFALCSFLVMACGTKKNRKEGQVIADFADPRAECQFADEEHCIGFIEASDIDRLKEKVREQSDSHEELPDLDNPSQSEDEPWTDDVLFAEEEELHLPEFPRQPSKLLVKRARSRLTLGGKMKTDDGCLIKAKAHHKFGIVLESTDFEPAPNTKNLGDSAKCQMTLELRYPKGYQFAIKQLDTQIRSDIADSSLGHLRVSFGFKKSKPDYELERIYQGNRLYHELNQLKIHPSEWQWSSCRGKQRLRFQIEMSMSYKTQPDSPEKWEDALRQKQESGSDHGYLNLGDLSAKNMIPLHIAWRRCE